MSASRTAMAESVITSSSSAGTQSAGGISAIWSRAVARVTPMSATMVSSAPAMTVPRRKPVAASSIGKIGTHRM